MARGNETVVDLAGEATSGQRRGRPNGKRADPRGIQDLFVNEFIMAAKLAATAQSIGTYRSDLERLIGQNSEETRRHYIARIFAWLFPNGQLDAGPVLTWKHYHDDRLLLDSLRVSYLQAIPMLARFLDQLLAHVAVGELLPSTYIHEFGLADCGEPTPRNTAERLTRNAMKLGFLHRSLDGLVHVVPPYDPTSVVLELHRRFGQEPATVAFGDVAGNPFWRFIGVPDTGTLRAILYQAVEHGGIAKFVKADELDQVTMARPYAELLEARWRLP